MPFVTNFEGQPDGRVKVTVEAQVSTKEPVIRSRIMTKDELIECLKVSAEHSLKRGHQHTNECLWKEFGFEV